MTIESHESFFEELLPGIEANVRENDMIEPVAIIRLMDGRKSVASMGEFFQPGMKDAVVPAVDFLFQNKHVAMVAVISECWIANLSDEEAKEALSRSVRDHPRRVDGVLVSIYGCDRRDSIFSLKIKPGRSGVEKQGDYSSGNARGKFVRDNPEDN